MGKETLNERRGRSREICRKRKYKSRNVFKLRVYSERGTASALARKKRKVDRHKAHQENKLRGRLMQKESRKGRATLIGKAPSRAYPIETRHRRGLIARKKNRGRKKLSLGG